MVKVRYADALHDLSAAVFVAAIDHNVRTSLSCRVDHRLDVCPQTSEAEHRTYAISHQVSVGTVGNLTDVSRPGAGKHER